MGNRPSLDGELADVKRIVADFTAAFVKNYTKYYTIGLSKKQKRIMEKESQGKQWQLLKYKGAADAPVKKTGVFLKRSKHLKKWNERFFVVKGNYLIDYYAKEDDYKSNPGKPLGSINMSNYSVIRDVNDTLINRIIALAEKCKLNVDDFPKPEKFPDFTFSLYNERKDEIYLQCKDAEEHKEWCDIFERARWNCPRYDIQEDKIHLWAFPTALWRTRWEVDMWGWWYGGGGEVEMISSCINEQIMWTVMGRVDAKLTMPWAVRSRIRNGFMKTTDGIVTGAVGPAWKGVYDTVTKAAPTIEEKLKDVLSPIIEAELTMVKEINGMVESGAKDTLGEKVTPHLQPLLDVVFSPVNDAVKKLLRAFEVSLEKGKDDYKPDEKRNFLIRRHLWTSEFWDAERHIWDLYDPLWVMRKIFDNVSPWTIQWKARKRMRTLLQNALFTFETKFEELKESAKEAGTELNDELTAKFWGEAAEYVKPQLAADCKTAVMKILGYILFGVVEDMWSLLVVKPARMLVKPLAEKVPDAIKDFLDPEDILEKVLYGILMSACKMVFEPYASKVSLE